MTLKTGRTTVRYNGHPVFAGDVNNLDDVFRRFWPDLLNMRKRMKNEKEKPKITNNDIMGRSWVI